MQKLSAGKAEQYIGLFIRREGLRQTGLFASEEAKRLNAANRSTSASQAFLRKLDRFKGIDAEVHDRLCQVLEGNSEPLAEHLDEAAEELARQVDRAKAVWHQRRTALNCKRFQLFEEKGSERIAGQLASLLSVDKRWFWLFGLVAIATLVGVVLHDRRHEVRRWLSGGRPRAMGLSKFLSATLLVLVVLTLTTFLMGDRIYHFLLAVGTGQEATPGELIETEIAEIKKDCGSMQSTIDNPQSTILLDNLPADTGLPDHWVRTRRSILQITTQLAVLANMPAEMDADRRRGEELGRQLARRVDQRQRHLRLREGIRAALGTALVGLTAIGGFLFWRGVRQRAKITANTCPQCLGQDRLTEVPAAEGGGTGRPSGVGMLRCKNVISKDPYDECEYTFAADYRAMTKLCLPTLGVPQAGKTHWLAMLYWQLCHGNYPKTIQFEKIRSPVAEDFDVILEEILTSRIGTAATQRDRIPSPLVFNFQDHDRLGRSSVLLNIFDYSGEVTSDMMVDDYRRRRALEGDGFFFFLDPTYPAETQAKAMADFREDLRLLKGVEKRDKQLRTPVALCVSKIDIMAGQAYATAEGPDVVDRFYEELARIDPSGEAMTLEVIEARSAAVAQLRSHVWPGWQIERQIHDLFGGRHMFFPLTPVGLDGRGETDLSLRTISPFGLLEPLLWLLEMSGYPILK